MRKVSTKYFTEEDHIQYQIVCYLDVSPRYKDVLYVHVPNEGRGKISFNQMNKIKALGVKAGVSDLLFFEARQGYHGLAIEVKTQTGTVSKAQRTFLANLKHRGWLTAVARSFEQAKQIIDDYFQSNQLYHDHDNRTNRAGSARN